MRVLLAGTPALAIPIFDAIFKSDIDTLGVITNPPKSKGRSNQLVPSPVSEWARERNLAVHEDGNLSKIRDLISEADLVLVVAFGKLIPRELLELPKYGWANIHFSHLPEARGAAPVQRLIAQGATEIGYTLFRLDEGMDTGPIYFRSKTVSIAQLTTGETWELLTNRASQEIVSLLHQVESGLIPIPQDSYKGPNAIAPKISTEEARIVWDESSVVVANKVRAFNPAPSAWTTLRNERFIIHRVGVANVNLPQKANPGALWVLGDSAYVATGDGWIELIEVQQSGKRKYLTSEWLRGFRVRAEESFR